MTWRALLRRLFRLGLPMPRTCPHCGGLGVWREWSAPTPWKVSLLASYRYRCEDCFFVGGWQ